MLASGIREQTLDIRLHVKRRRCGVVAPKCASIRVDEELLVVPGHHAPRAVRQVVLHGSLEEHVRVARAVAVHDDFVEHDDSRVFVVEVEFVKHVRPLARRRARRLRPKLVGGERQHLESSVSVLLQKLNDSWVVDVLQASGGRDVDDQGDVSSVHVEFRVCVRVHDFDVVQAFVLVSHVRGWRVRVRSNWFTKARALRRVIRCACHVR
mmetsp:Transcript_6209/g.16086  ORF Transcript_6209/g.16086 Transcript_6209/m.16086 type:complete len:209 (+) Transcript_6209:226-852(+)|eukprot:CAMPEP_0119191944 /NCGR_PEP_ID=MMETSP1316-20130426/2593_1 /TAXON_ID=41880 /ORGANISM="Pycnococcus provasolii, Strain RCC2336" /LENGTH=208 /DNA_ID=CAMNT_0007187047 /DNA_START=193 /DNA_END=819 /DNA_ORIENTATION=+